MPYNVLHLIGGGEIGGAERHVLNLLRNFDQSIVRPYLGCLHRNSPFAEAAKSEGVDSAVFSMRFPLDLSPLPAIVRYCRFNKISLIHSHGVRANLLGRLAAKILRIPSITTVHSLPEYDYPASWKGKTALWLDNLTLPLSSGIIVVSESLRKAVQTRLANQHRSRNLPVKTVYNGYPILSFGDKKTMREEFRKKWGISEDHLVIGTIGRLHPVKGQIHLVQALQILVKSFPNLHFLLIGEGPLYDRLKEALVSANLSFTMTGYLPSAWTALPAMDLFVLPSLSEGMGLVLLEAVQAGIPIVASETGGIPELLRNKTDALLVPPGNSEELAAACRQVLASPDLASKLTTSAARRVSLFGIKKMVEDTVSFYRTALGSNK